jgi:hypothetical protein
MAETRMRRSSAAVWLALGALALPVPGLAQERAVRDATRDATRRHPEFPPYCFPEDGSPRIQDEEHPNCPNISDREDAELLPPIPDEPADPGFPLARFVLGVWFGIE